MAGRRCRRVRSSEQMMRSRLLAACIVTVIMAGCASVPTGPDVMALPGTGKNFDEFRTDDLACRDFAFRQIGGVGREKSANDAVLRNAAIGTAIGAVAGAAIGGRDGAGVGAGTGLLVGGLSGSEFAQSSLQGSQRQYDNAYIQCMYAKGHRVPVSGTYTTTPAVPPPAPVVPPPPAGMPPPPPAGIVR